jgi:hypothetical protein
MNFETSFSFHKGKLCRYAAWCLLLLMLGSFFLEKSRVFPFNAASYGCMDEEAMDVEQAEEATLKVEGKERALLDYLPIGLPPDSACLVLDWRVERARTVYLSAVLLPLAEESQVVALPFYILYHRLIC